MGFKCGIVGLPNVGKSTLFNALTETMSAEAQNYPFCTIEPNIGKVSVPDPRLYALAKMAQSAKIIPNQLEFVDIAGLVKGASEGQGLGNKFLGHIRETNAIIHMVRCFVDLDITHVEGSIDPLRDIEIIETELMLADLESLEKRQGNMEKKLKQGKDPELALQYQLLLSALDLLRAGKPARTLDIAKDQMTAWQSLQLITAKPTVYVCNVMEHEAFEGNYLCQSVMDFAQAQGSSCVIISAAIESEAATLDPEDRIAYLQTMGLQETGLARVIREGYKILNLFTFFTIGPKEAHAWTVAQGATAPQAAGVIHTDFERGFICAETISFQDYTDYNGEAGAKTAGKLRLEGKTYCVNDGDIFHFRFNV